MYEYVSLNSNQIKLTTYFILAREDDGNDHTAFGLYSEDVDDIEFINTTTSRLAGWTQRQYGSGSNTYTVPAFYVSKIKFTLPEGIQTNEIKIQLCKPVGIEEEGELRVQFREGDSGNYTTDTMFEGLGFSGNSLQVGKTPNKSSESIYFPETPGNANYVLAAQTYILNKTNGYYWSGNYYLYLYQTENYLCPFCGGTGFYGNGSTLHASIQYLALSTDTDPVTPGSGDNPLPTTDPSSTLGPPTITSSTVGKQYDYISENSSKKDFSTLYSHLQEALQARSYSSSLFSQNIKTFYENNKNKTFSQNTPIQKSHADYTINKILKFKNGLQSKNQFDIINSINNYDDIVLKLKQGNEETPYCCVGECVGFCITNCGTSCIQTCKGESRNTYQDAKYAVGCLNACSSVCARECGDGCYGTCSASETLLADSLFSN